MYNISILYLCIMGTPHFFNGRARARRGG